MFPTLFAALGIADYGVLLVYLAAMLAIGVYFNSTQNSTEEFFLASRSLGWFPLGLSLMATLISAMTYTALPGQAYEVGVKTLLMPLALWLTIPILWGVAIPIFRGLRMSSIYEYLELRFDARTRLAATILFAVWRLLWLGGVLYAPCKAFSIAAGWSISEGYLIFVLGIVTTGYTFLGGMKAVIWTDVIQGIVMLGGVVVVVTACWLMIDGGPTRVWNVANLLHRTEVVSNQFSWLDRWSLLGFLPHFTLAMLSFYLADQITAQRFLTATSVDSARQSFLWNCGALTFLFPGLTYIGLCLLAYYHDHPGQMRPEWVVNLAIVDGKQQYQTGADGRPLLDFNRPEHRLIPANLPQLVQEKRILHPNRLEPFESVEEFVDPDTGAAVVTKLMKRKPDGEPLIQSQASEKIFTAFIADHLPVGIAGLVLAALLAASMSSVDSGLNSICTLLILDCHQRFGWGTTWLAKRCGRASREELTDEDRLHLARPLTLVIGVAATLFGLMVSQFGNVFEIMVGVVNTFGAPLLGIFLLGMFTRRTTATAAFSALLAGTVFTVWFMVSNRWHVLQVFPSVNEVWTVTFGTLFTVLWGWCASFVTGPPLPIVQLRGLVYGCGELGILDKKVQKPHPTGSDPARWR